MFGSREGDMQVDITGEEQTGGESQKGSRRRSSSGREPSPGRLTFEKRPPTAGQRKKLFDNASSSSSSSSSSLSQPQALKSPRSSDLELSDDESQGLSPNTKKSQDLLAMNCKRRAFTKARNIMTC